MELSSTGRLTTCRSADLEGDGREDVLLGGVNNGNHQATLVVLDPFAIHGQSTPAVITDDRFRIIGMPRAHEKAVVLFPRTPISATERYTRVADVRVLADRIVVVVAEGMDEMAPPIIYELDFNLRVLSVSPDHRASRAYQALNTQMTYT